MRRSILLGFSDILKPVGRHDCLQNPVLVTECRFDSDRPHQHKQLWKVAVRREMPRMGPISQEVLSGAAH
jgi:hypothetical protein